MQMNERIDLKNILFFCLKFMVFAPVCLVLWGYLIPTYAWLVGQASGTIAMTLLNVPVEGMRVEPMGLINRETLLVFDVVGVRDPLKLEIVLLVANMAPYVALVLSTGGMKILRRLAVLAIGVSILALTHIIFLSALFAMGKSQVLETLGQLFVTLPFLLWIMLAFWRNLVELIDSAANQDKDAS